MNSWQRAAMDPFQEQKISPKRKFWPGYPCGHPAKNFGQALQILEKQAFRDGHPARTSMKKLRSEKLRADFSFPTSLIGAGLLETRQEMGLDLSDEEPEEDL